MKIQSRFLINIIIHGLAIFTTVNSSSKSILFLKNDLNYSHSGKIDTFFHFQQTK